MHAYTKLLFPELREKRFVWGHRQLGHKVKHYGSPELSFRCCWRCDCGKRYWC